MNWKLSHGSWWQGVHGSWLQSQNAELSPTVAACGLLCSPRVSKVSTVTVIGGVLVAKLKTVVAFGLVCCPRISEGLHFFVCFFACSLDFVPGVWALRFYGCSALEFSALGL